ncbi:MAG: transposase, partial [Tepidisphaeraceae bacterium]
MEQATSQSGWDLSRLTESVLKAGGRVLEHGPRLFVDLAASAAPLWALLLARLERWRLPVRWGQVPTPRPRPWVPPPAHAHRSLVLR